MSAATGSDRLQVAPAAALVGELAVHGDKSISHRSLLIGAVCDGIAEVTRLRRRTPTRCATLAAVERSARASSGSMRRRRACASTAAGCAG